MPQKITLKDDESAIVFKNNGKDMIYLNKKDENRDVSPANYKLGLIVFMLNNEKLYTKMSKEFMKSIDASKDK